MKWDTFFSKSKQQNTSSLFQDFDKKLIKNLSKNGSIPSWSQMKYIGNFLNNREKKQITGLVITMVVGLLTSAALLVATHATTIPKEGGQYSEAFVGQPQYVNPLFSGLNDIDADLVSLIYSGLFTYDQNQELVPDLAQDVTTSIDKKTYTITLRNNVRWSDGEKFDADDVLYTFELIQNSEAASPLYTSFQGVQIQKVNDYMVRFVLKDAFTPFLNSLTTGILPEHIWSPISHGSLSSLKLAENNLKPVGTGPWKFDKFVKKNDGSIQAYYLSKNEFYYGKRPYLNTISFEFFEGCQKAVDEVQSQHVLAMSFVNCKTRNELQKKQLALYDVTLPQYTALFFNQDDSTDLKDKNLRQALALATNKEQIITKALDGAGAIIDSPILEGSIGYNRDLPKTAYDIEQANTLLDKKWSRIQPEEYFNLRKKTLSKQFNDSLRTVSSSPTDSSTSSIAEGINDTVLSTIRNEMPSTQTFYRKDKNNVPLQLTITTVEIPEYEKTAQVIREQWQALGVQTSVIVVKKNDIKKELLKNHNFDILLYGELVGVDSDLFPFWHSSQTIYPGLNLAQFSNRDADKLLEEARSSADSQKRAELNKQFQTILASEIPAIFLNTPTYTLLINKDIKGVQIHHLVLPSDRYKSISDWYIKTSFKWK
jgi:peptide/nickel transport system substrate-binding protein